MSSNVFNEQGYVVVRNFIDAGSISIISKYFENKINRGEWVPRDNATTSKFSYYADPLVEVFLDTSTQDVEKACGLELVPTYSYSRVYREGEELRPHLDRPACEISVTVNVASKGELSPIYVEYKDNQPKKYILGPGDAIIYKGCEVLHWRRPLREGQLNVQFMLHFIDKNGPNVPGHIFDGRERIGMDSIVK